MTTAETIGTREPSIKVVGSEYLAKRYNATINIDELQKSLHHPETKKQKDVEVIISDNPIVRMLINRQNKKSHVQKEMDAPASMIIRIPFQPDRIIVSPQVARENMARGMNTKIPFWRRDARVSADTFDGADDNRFFLDRELNRAAHMNAMMEEHGVELGKDSAAGVALVGIGALMMTMAAVDARKLTDPNYHESKARSIARLGVLGLGAAATIFGAVKMVKANIDTHLMRNEAIQVADQETRERDTEPPTRTPIVTILRTAEARAY